MKHLKVFGTILSLCFIPVSFGTAHASPPVPSSAGGSEYVATSEEKECMEDGGKWGRFGMIDKWQCNHPTQDHGKACTDSSECESFCQADDHSEIGEETNGSCYQWTLDIGTCLSRVENGVVGPALCVD